MALDDELISAIRESVVAQGQPDSVAKRIIAWLTEMSESEMSRDDSARHLETVRAAITVETEAEDDDGIPS